MQSQHPGDITTDHLKVAPKGAQDADRSTGGSPNMSGTQGTGGTLDPMAGPMDPVPDNEDYKRFAFDGHLAVSPFPEYGTERDDAREPTRRDGGEHAGWGRGG